jgi:hypothetical protein
VLIQLEDGSHVTAAVARKRKEGDVHQQRQSGECGWTAGQQDKHKYR